MSLLDDVRTALRVKRFSLATEECYVRWVEKFVRFHKRPDGWRHPKDMGAPEVEAFLTHLAIDGHVAASTQNQALNALVFLHSTQCGRAGPSGCRWCWPPKKCAASSIHSRAPMGPTA